MCASRTPTRAEVTGWSPVQLANYLRKMSLTGCDAVVIKNSISGSRFVDLSENDLQKFPKLHIPLIYKISAEISRKEERRRFFTKKSPTPKYPDPAENVVGWADDEFDDDANYSSDDNDYVDPNSSDDNGYEDPNSDDDNADRYEDPPREDLNHLRTSEVKISNSYYSDNRDHHPSARPPELLPRPMPSTLPKASRRDHSPHVHNQLPERGQPPKPQIFRDKKPGRDSGPSPSPLLGASHRGSEVSYLQDGATDSSSNCNFQFSSPRQQRSSANRAPIEPPGPRPQPKPWTPAPRYEDDGWVSVMMTIATTTTPLTKPFSLTEDGRREQTPHLPYEPLPPCGARQPWQQLTHRSQTCHPTSGAERASVPCFSVPQGPGPSLVRRPSEQRPG
ncbi:lymphocyte cytosolic protein 2-like isoform 1-T1 [Synchiropus picturatus]